MKNTTFPLENQDFLLPGPVLLRKKYGHKMTLTELGIELRESRTQIYKRIKMGKFRLPIWRSDAGRPFVLVDDVVRYLYSSSSFIASMSPAVSPAVSPSPVAQEEKRKRGRPRKTPVTS